MDLQRKNSDHSSGWQIKCNTPAKFSKLSVGRASALSVKGKSGKGVGFTAKSKTYTKADGTRLDSVSAIPEAAVWKKPLIKQQD